MNYTISAVARRFGLSRSALLYYDSIGILSPKRRSRADYRMYTDKDISLMEEIARLRSAGLALKEIKRVLGRGTSQREITLHKRLNGINEEISKLRQQQTFILTLLKDKEIARSTRTMTKEKWISYLRKAGLDDAGMIRWHQEFEASSPQAHQDFLESLGLKEEEIRLIRDRSRTRNNIA